MYYQVCSNDDPRLGFDLFSQVSESGESGPHEKKKKKKKADSTSLRNPGRDSSIPIFTRKEIETKRIRKEIKTITSRLSDLLSFLSNI